MRLLLVRHTRPRVLPGICYGRTDLDLADSFVQEAEGLMRRLGDLSGAALYSSPLRRCARLAHRLGEPCFDERLREMDFGGWESRRWAEIDRAEIDAWAADLADWRPPGGETVREVAERALGFVTEQRRRGVGQICAVTHNGVIRTLCAALWQQPLSEAGVLDLPFASALDLRLEADGARVHAVHADGPVRLPSWMQPRPVSETAPARSEAA